MAISKPKVFEVNFASRSMRDKVSGVLPTISGTPELKRGDKGYGLSSSMTSNGFLTYNTPLTGGTYSVVIWLAPNAMQSAYPIFLTSPSSSGGAGGMLFFNGSTGTLNMYGGGTTFVDNVATNVVSLNKVSCIIYSGTTFPTLTSLFINGTGGQSLKGGSMPYIAIYEGTLTSAERDQLYQDFLRVRGVTSSPTFLRPSSVGEGTPLFTETGFNFCPHNVTYTSGQYLESGWFVSSGSFKVNEDSDGKYVECVTNGTIQWKGFDLSTYSSDGYIRELVGDISSDEGKALHNASYVSSANNTISVVLTAGQKLYKLVINAYYLRIPLSTTAGRFNMIVSGGGLTDATVSWDYPDGTATAWDLNPDKTLTAGGIVYLNFWKQPDWSTLAINANDTDAQLTADLSVFSRLTYYLALGNCSNITGDLSDISGMGGTLNLYRCSNITGDLSDVSGAASLNLYRCSNITGDLSDVSGVTYYLSLYLCTNITGILSLTATLTTIYLNSTNTSAADISQSLVNLEAVTTVTGLFQATHIPINQLTTAGEDARALLVTAGWTITLGVAI